MSLIDQYEHSTVGYIYCPSDFPFVYNNDATRLIAVYRLNEVCDELGAKVGDLVVGGGDGECPAMRIGLVEASDFYTKGSIDELPDIDRIHKCFWSPTMCYVLGEGFRKLGWVPGFAPNDWLESWITRHILVYLSKTSPEILPRPTGAFKLDV